MACFYWNYEFYLKLITTFVKNVPFRTLHLLVSTFVFEPYKNYNFRAQLKKVFSVLRLINPTMPCVLLY